MGKDVPDNVVCDPESGVCRYVVAADEIGAEHVHKSETKDAGAIGRLLGDSLVGKTGLAVPTASISGPGKVVGLYFSAHWCGPCRAFTPELVKAYNQFKQQHARKEDFAIVFVSSDHDQSSFDSYYADMPWLALPFSERATKAQLSKKFGVRGIPTLVIIDGETEKLITANGRNSVSSDPQFADFPWAPKPFSEVLRGDLVDNKGKVVSVQAALQGKVKLLYFSAHWCPPCKKFTPELVKTYKKLKAAGKNAEVVFATGDRSESQFNEYMAEMPWLAVPFSDKPRLAALSEMFEVEGIPTLIVLDENDKVITRDGRTAVMSDPDGLDFPWHPKALDELSMNNAGSINEVPALLLLVNSKAPKDRAELLLRAPAEKHRANAAADPLNFFYGQMSDDLAEQLLEFAGVSDAKEDTLMLLDITSQSVYVAPERGAEITNAVVDGFLGGYYAGSLTAKPLGG